MRKPCRHCPAHLVATYRHGDLHTITIEHHHGGPCGGRIDTIQDHTPWKPRYSDLPDGEKEKLADAARAGARAVEQTDSRRLNQPGRDSRPNRTRSRIARS